MRIKIDARTALKYKICAPDKLGDMSIYPVWEINGRLFVEVDADTLGGITLTDVNNIEIRHNRIHATKSYTIRVSIKNYYTDMLNDVEIKTLDELKNKETL